jgi:hypothetical protein
VQQAQVGTIQFLKAGEAASKMRDLVDEAFDQMALSIQPLILRPQDFRALMRRNDRFDTLCQQLLDKIRRCISAIRDQALKTEPSKSACAWALS